MMNNPSNIEDYNRTLKAELERNLRLLKAKEDIIEIYTKENNTLKEELKQSKSVEILKGLSREHFLTGYVLGKPVFYFHKDPEENKTYEECLRIPPIPQYTGLRADVKRLETENTSLKAEVKRLLECIEDHAHGLNEVQDNFDGEGARRPSKGSIERAIAFSRKVSDLALDVEVSPDVLGGVDVYLTGHVVGRSVWYFFKNSGEVAITYANGENVSSVEESLSNILLLPFLRGDSGETP